MSPAATITDEEARRSILVAADDAFYRRGIAAVTVAAIRDDAGVSLRRLYALFPTKSDLVAAWLEQRHRTWMAWLRREVEAGTASGATPTDALFDALGAWLESSGFRGCGFVNSLAETAELTVEHTTIIEGHKQTLIDYLGAFTDRPDALAVIVDGAIVQASVFRSVAPIEAARVAATALLTATERNP